MINLVDQTRPSSNDTAANTVEAVLDDTIGNLGEGHGNLELETVLAQFGQRVLSLDPIQRQIAKTAAINHLEKLKVRRAARMIDALELGTPTGNDGTTSGSGALILL